MLIVIKCIQTKIQTIANDTLMVNIANFVGYRIEIKFNESISIFNVSGNSNGMVNGLLIRNTPFTMPLTEFDYTDIFVSSL